MRIKGHKLTIEWNGERSREESASTGTCICGWQESCSTQEVVRDEYHHHLRRVAARLLATTTKGTMPNG